MNFDMKAQTEDTLELILRGYLEDNQLLESYYGPVYENQDDFRINQHNIKLLELELILRRHGPEAAMAYKLSDGNLRIWEK